MIKKNILAFFLLCACSVSAFAHELRLPSFFSNGMVLQRDTKVAVWGWGTPKERVTIEFKGKKATATVKADGSWKAFLPKMEASGEGTDLTVREQGTGKVLTISNVLVGDVFLCSGQSNMELPMRRCMDKVAGLVKDYSNSQIRYVKLPHQFYVRYDRPERNPWLKEGLAKGIFTGKDDPDYKKLLDEIVKARPMLDLRNDVDFRDVIGALK